MKKLAILSAIALSGLIFNTADAQIRISLGLHVKPIYASYHTPVIVEQPVYQEPVQAYDDSNDDDYYYLPDVDAYYDVDAGCYYYNDGYNWVSAAFLPGAYRNYDWRSARRFEVHEHRPFARADFYRSRYNGRQVAEFRNDHRDNGYSRGNDNRGGGYNRSEQNRDNDNHHGNRRQGGYNQPSYPNHNQSNGNHGQGGYSQPSNPSQNNGSHGQGGYNQPSAPSQNNGGHGQGGYGQPNQNNGGHESGQGHSARPNQNNGGTEGQARGANEHFAQNMGMSHRMARH